MTLVPYSYLFYCQSAGVNFLKFSIILLAAHLLLSPDVIRNKGWLAAAIASIISGASVMLYGNTLSVLTNILSLCLASGFYVTKESSLLFTFAHSVYTYISSIPCLFRDLREKKQSEASFPLITKLMISVFPVVIFSVFFFLYRASNPLFSSFTDNINLNFITWQWIGFMLLGILMMRGFFYPRQIISLAFLDAASSDIISENEVREVKGNMTIRHENISGIVLFTMLNMLLLTVNMLDINFVWVNKKLPEGLNHADFIHSGINTLIFSIILAIALILYYFRGGLNFFQSNKPLLFLALAWIFQNSFLILSSMIKNNMYVEENGLTYKRIGVYIYLFLCLIGLVTTLIKVLKKRSNWFLLRKNSWAFYTVLVACTLVNWDLLIVRYSIAFAKYPDIRYMANMSDSVIPDLYTYIQITNNPEDTVLLARLQHRIENFKYTYAESDWQSWNFEDQRIYKSCKKLDQK